MLKDLKELTEVHLRILQMVKQQDVANAFGIKVGKIVLCKFKYHIGDVSHDVRRKHKLVIHSRNKNIK